MTKPAERFYLSIKDVSKLTSKDLVGLFVYHLTVELGQPAARASDIELCFRDSDLRVPERIASYLSEGLNGKSPRFVKTSGGYRLEVTYKGQLSKLLGAERIVTQTSSELRVLEANLPAGPKREFLRETVDCFEAGASRAAVIMCWVLTMDHLFEHVLKHKHAAFNAVLAANTDKRVKITSINVRDDFTEIPESKFIEFCKSAGVISKDVRKILDEKLGIRNSAAHPSGVTIKPSKAIEFIEDLVSNVLQKFPV